MRKSWMNEWRHRMAMAATLASAVLAALIAAMPADANAQVAALPPPKVPEDCPSIADNEARLACYDRLHRRPLAAEPPSAATRVPVQPVPAALPVAVAASAPATDPCSRLPEAAGSARNYLGSTLSERWELSCRDQMPRFLPRPYKPVYLLPVSWTTRSNRAPGRQSDSPDNALVDALDLDKNEAKFQISLKSKIWALDDHGSLSLWGAYTQSSRWQVYNGRVSRPFRETNYEPELILTHGTDVALPFGWKASMVGLSLNHQSNGRAEPLSRSWNRVIGELSLERGETTVSLRPWWRILNSGSDDNPGIQDYVGRGEVLVTQKLGRHVLALTARHSLRFGDRSRGSAQLEWAFPIGGGLHGYLQLFNGYGESLIDYNFRETRVGVGVSVIEWR
ncbi:phospholipase A [Mitsuaria sp. GD03876]|uniref:phospholipase A n=1 Tax=Mitsuaria sp. GD03876 TaxID=2975399 RepID=UPI00244A63AE|nr:phospholipase A [Mitsuaria sp. GD03876]MDH0868238.1 phospholipase A [Mitsuaria sp. GD03876]